MKVKIDEEACTGCGICADLCPEIFELTDDKVRIKREPENPDDESCIEEAKNSCPSEAIIIE